MSSYKHREISSVQFMGEHIRFVASNDRLRDRISKLSNERYVLEKLVEVTNPNDVFWDVGACLGIHTFIMSKHLPYGDVVGFEPMQTNQGVLIDNMSVNEITNTTIHPQALSNKNGTAEFEIRESMQAGHGRHGLKAGQYNSVKTVDIETVAGDSLIVGGTPPPNVIKIDVEGAGGLVLEGLQNVLSHDSCREVIFETHEPNPVQPSHEDFGYTREDIIQLLENAGFTVTELENHWHLHGTKQQDNPIKNPSFNVQVIQGDIAEQSADVIVNSAGTSMRMGTGVAGALREKAGEEINNEAIEKGPVDVGDAVVTDAYGLNAEYVIHACSMPHYGKGRATLDTIKQALRNTLIAADDLGCTSICIPAIGCGLGGVSLSAGSKAINSVLTSYEPENITDVIIVAYTDDEHQTISRNIMEYTQ